MADAADSSKQPRNTPSSSRDDAVSPAAPLTHRYSVGDWTIFIDPETGERLAVRILSVLWEDDGSPIYGVHFKLSDRVSCVADSQLIPRIRITHIDTPPLK